MTSPMAVFEADAKNTEGLYLTIQNIAAEMSRSDPTRTTYLGLTGAYDFFNVRLFGDQLPRCLITMQRGRAYYGYFWGDRFGTVDGTEVTDEIALNPSYLHGRSTEENLSTLVHEMAHLAQHHFGKPSRNGYHNKQWAALMNIVGLIPSDTGLPGGKQTGQRVSHYILIDGPFDLACRELIALGFTIPYVELLDKWAVPVEGNNQAGANAAGRRAASKSKAKYSCPCPRCPQNVWGKRGLNIDCGNHKQRMVMS